jgi:hypothetical protein
MTQENLVYLDFALPEFPFIPLIPEEYLPVSETFANKSPVQIFGECMRTHSISAMCAPSYCGETQKRTGDSCGITELDCSIIEKVLSQPSSSKTILFVGFDQTSPEEGGNIYAHTPGYERSLFLSAWEERPSGDHNQIKTCFCQMPRLLEMYSGMRNAFDYIIVGGGTDSYVYPEAWVAFGHMLKPGGRLVRASDEGKVVREIFSLFLNKILMESVAEEGFSFELYACNDALEPVYQEIQQLAGFNTGSIWCSESWGYAKEGAAFCWHKKTVPSRE